MSTEIESSQSSGLLAFPLLSEQPKKTENVIIDNNTSRDQSVISLNYGSKLNMSNCIISNNTGDGIHISDSGYRCDSERPCATVYVKNSLIYENTGIGIKCQGYPQFVIINCTIADNGGFGLYVHDDVHGSNVSGVQAIINSILWDNYPSSIDVGGQGFALSFTYNDIDQHSAGQGNINADPLFVNLQGGNFSLQEGSPCIDAGDPESGMDPDGTYPDMGAYYYHQSEIAPYPPQNLIATPGDNQATLTWSPNSDNDFASYRIYGGTSPNRSL